MKHPNELIIIDPLNNKNNVAERTFHFGNVKIPFLIGYAFAKDNCECSCHYLSGASHNSFEDKDHCILKKIFKTVKRLTNNMN